MLVIGFVSHWVSGSVRVTGTLHVRDLILGRIFAWILVICTLSMESTVLHSHGFFEGIVRPPAQWEIQEFKGRTAYPCFVLSFHISNLISVSMIYGMECVVTQTILLLCFITSITCPHWTSKENKTELHVRELMTSININVL